MKEIDKDNAFRTDATDTERPVAEIPVSTNGKNIYVYDGGTKGLTIKIKDGI